MSSSVRLIRIGTFVLVAGMLACGGSSTPNQPTPSVTVTSITVGVAGNAPAVVAPGEKLQLFAQAAYSDGSRADVTNAALWQSSNPVVATVSNGGLLTAATEGGLDVSATYQARSGAVHADVQKRTCNATLSPGTLAFGPFGATGTVQVSLTDAACRWTARSDTSWLGFSYDPGKSGDGAFTYTVPGNSTPNARTANIVVTVEGGPSATHRVQQDRPAGCSYVVSPDHADFPNSGGSSAFDVVTTPSDCHWTAAPGAALRITLTGRTNGTGGGRVTYRVDSNPLATDVTEQIQIRGDSGLNPPGVHTLTVAKK